MKILNKLPEFSERDLFHFTKNFKTSSLNERVTGFEKMLNYLSSINQLTYQRMILSSTGRTVMVKDNTSNEKRKMLLFASNNYLGFATHPYILEKVVKSIKEYGIGVGGPPLLNGYCKLMNELEDRLSSLKKKENTLIYSSGYSANLGMASSFTSKNNCFVVDKLSHASFFDGLSINNSNYRTFHHNDIFHLDKVLSSVKKSFDEIFICVEGVYSMDGDLAPLPEIINLSKKYSAVCIVDDAHGAGVLGKNGGGTTEHFHVEDEVDIVMGTFSKVFSVTGGFISGDKAYIDYLRYFSRSYMFSAALPPSTIAAVLAGLDIIEKEPWRREMLLNNTAYAISKLLKFELVTEPKSAIISIKIPKWMDIRAANSKLDKMGIFLNAIEYPAVPFDQQRFRISLTVDHTKEDIDKLVSCMEEVWNELEP